MKAGYKQTEVGVSFGEIFEENLTRKKINGDDIVTFLGMQDLSEEASIIKQHEVSFSHVKSGFTYFERNDTLVAKITPCFENGKGAFLGELTTLVGFGSTEFHVLRAKDGNDPKYIYHHTRSDAFRKKLEKEMVGSAGHRRVPFVEIQKYLLPVKHNLAEQTAIAKALSDTDALIQSLSQLIAKKRQIKQGAMQTLLNPYDETGALKAGWVVRVIEEIADVKSGKRLPLGKFLTNKETNHPYIRVTDMYFGGVDLEEIMYVPNEVYPLIKNYRIFKNDIFISVAGTLGIVGKIPDELDGGNLTENANRFTNIQCDQNYLLFVLSSPLTQSIIESERTLGAQPKLALTRIRKFKIPLPKDKTEQTKIAKILTDMDTEITTLETKLSKYQKIKQGMMQNLLTGRIRLVTPSLQTAKDKTS